MSTPSSNISAPAADFSRRSPRGRLLTTKDAAAYLGIVETRMRRLVRDGEVAVLRNKNGRVVGFYAEDLDAWVERCRQPAACDRRTVRLVDLRMKDLLEERVS